MRSVRVAASAAVVAACFVTVGAGAAGASTSSLLFDRGLPTANINTYPPSPSSNLRIAGGSGVVGIHMLGDNFRIASSGLYVIDDVRTWVVGPGGRCCQDPKFLNTDPSQLTPYVGDFMSDLRLYLGDGTLTDGVKVVAMGTLPLGSNTVSNPDIQASPTTYANGEPWKYVGFTTAFTGLYQLDFANTHVVLNGGTTYDVAAWGLGRQFASNPTKYYPFYNSFSVASDPLADGIGDRFLTANGAYDASFDTSHLFYGTATPIDMNVQVYGHVMSKDDCKNGGWAQFQGPAAPKFANQGDCVSFIATGGRNQPGLGNNGYGGGDDNTVDANPS